LLAVSLSLSSEIQGGKISMRRIGTLDNSELAQRFCDYLVTQSIASMCDPDSDDADSGWNIWVRDERQIDQAKKELADFLSDPDGSRYQVKREATQIRQEQIAAELARQKREAENARIANVSKSALGEPIRAPLKQSGIPVTIAVIILSVIASMTTNFSAPLRSRIPGKTTLGEQVYNTLRFVDEKDDTKSGHDPFASVETGQVWRFVTPMFLHGDEFHLLFNMVWIYFLGSVIEKLQGSAFLVVLLVTTQIAGMLLQVMLPDTAVLQTIFQGTPLDFLAQTMSGSSNVVGASGAVYGLFGFLWIRPKVDPGYPIHLVQINIVLMLGWLVICITPLIGGVANGGHIGGLLAGMGFGFAGKLKRG
jgi:GlpG protein